MLLTACVINKAFHEVFHVGVDRLYHEGREPYVYPMYIVTVGVTVNVMVFLGLPYGLLYAILMVG